jgi:hypothetical protein
MKMIAFFMKHICLSEIYEYEIISDSPMLFIKDTDDAILIKKYREEVPKAEYLIPYSREIKILQGTGEGDELEELVKKMNEVEEKEELMNEDIENEIKEKEKLVKKMSDAEEEEKVIKTGIENEVVLMNEDIENDVEVIKEVGEKDVENDVEVIKEVGEKDIENDVEVIKEVGEKDIENDVEVIKEVGEKDVENESGEKEKVFLEEFNKEEDDIIRSEEDNIFKIEDASIINQSSLFSEYNSFYEEFEIISKEEYVEDFLDISLNLKNNQKIYKDLIKLVEDYSTFISDTNDRLREYNRSFRHIFEKLKYDTDHKE